jgi:hypothetical protein
MWPLVPKNQAFYRKKIPNRRSFLLPQAGGGSASQFLFDDLM